MQIELWLLIKIGKISKDLDGPYKWAIETKKVLE